MLLLIFGDELFYYTTFKFICQPLFRSFFKFSFLWRSLLRDNFNIISHSKFFVKYFFQVFSKNFFVTAVPFPDQLFYYITSKTLLSTPFQKFFKFVFRDISAIFATAFLLYHFLIGLSSTFYLSFWFYQLISDTSPPDFRPLRTFVLNQQSYRSPFFRCALVRQLLYYSTYSMKCQHLRLPMFVFVFRQQIVYISDTYRPIISETAKYSDLRRLPW